jgi:LapD/MoxY periplasmic domain
MSLLRQLWLSVSTAMLIILLGTLVVSVFTARGYLEQQLLTQASDGASSLGLSITQQGTDPGTVETLVNATFDSGHFRIVRYVKTDGSIGVYDTLSAACTTGHSAG